MTTHWSQANAIHTFKGRPPHQWDAPTYIHKHTHTFTNTLTHVYSNGHWGCEQTHHGASPSARRTWGQSPTEWWSWLLCHHKEKKRKNTPKEREKVDLGKVVVPKIRYTVSHATRKAACTKMKLIIHREVYDVVEMGCLAVIIRKWQKTTLKKKKSMSG